MFRWEFALAKFRHRVHVLVWVDTLAEEETQVLFGDIGPLFSEPFEVFEACFEEVLSEGLQTRSEKHQRVLEDQVIEGESKILLHSLTDHSNLPISKVSKGFCNKVAVIPPEVMKEDGDFVCLFGPKIAVIVCGTNILTRYVIMISNLLVFGFGIEIDCLATNVTSVVFIVFLLLLRANVHAGLVPEEFDSVVSEFDHLLEEDIDAILTHMILVALVEFGNHTDNLPPNRTWDLLLVIESLVTSSGMGITSRLDEGLEISVDNEGHSMRETRKSMLSYVEKENERMTVREK